MTRGPTELGPPNAGIQVQHADGALVFEYDIKNASHTWMEYGDKADWVVLTYDFERLPTHIHDNVHELALRFKGIQALKGKKFWCGEIRVDHDEKKVSYHFTSELDES